MSRGAVRPAVCRAGPGSGALPLCRSKSSLPSESCRGVFAAWRGGCSWDVGGGCAPEAAASKHFPGWLPLSWAREKAAMGQAAWSPWAPAWGCAGAHGADLTAVFSSAHHPSLGAPVCRQSPSLSVRQLRLLVQELVTLKVRPLPLSDQIQCGVVFWFATCRERTSAWTQI